MGCRSTPRARAQRSPVWALLLWLLRMLRCRLLGQCSSQATLSGATAFNAASRCTAQLLHRPTRSPSSEPFPLSAWRSCRPPALPSWSACWPRSLKQPLPSFASLSVGRPKVPCSACRRPPAPAQAGVGPSGFAAAVDGCPCWTTKSATLSTPLSVTQPALQRPEANRCNCEPAPDGQRHKHNLNEPHT